MDQRREAQGVGGVEVSQEGLALSGAGVGVGVPAVVEATLPDGDGVVFGEPARERVEGGGEGVVGEFADGLGVDAEGGVHALVFLGEAGAGGPVVGLDGGEDELLDADGACLGQQVSGGAVVAGGVEVAVGVEPREGHGAPWESGAQTKTPRGRRCVGGRARRMGLVARRRRPRGGSLDQSCSFMMKMQTR
jgi:hypothetical protein